MKQLQQKIPLPQASAAHYPAPSPVLFDCDVARLSPAERAQAGWCIRFEVDLAPLTIEIPPTAGYPIGGLALHELRVDLTFATGGVEQTITLDAYPSFTMHIAAETISARMHWDVNKLFEPNRYPSGLYARTQVTRGLCPTTATKTDLVGKTTGLQIPDYATRWGLYLVNGAMTDDATKELRFRMHETGSTVHVYSNDDLDALVGGIAFPRVPPSAREYRWFSSADLDFSDFACRIVFFYGESFG